MVVFEICFEFCPYFPVKCLEWRRKDKLTYNFQLQFRQLFLKNAYHSLCKLIFFIISIQNNFHGSKTVFIAFAKKSCSICSVVKTYQGTSFCLVWINWHLEWELAPDKTFCKVTKKTLNGVCFASFFFPSYFIVKYLLNALPAWRLYFLIVTVFSFMTEGGEGRYCQLQSGACDKNR